MDCHTDVLIVGAGGGGALLGLLLARKGVDCLVVEQGAGPPQGLRGEILQPNGQMILDRLGLLDRVPSEAIRPVRHFHFRQVGGRRLCTIDYDLLPAPFNRALVMWPHVVHGAIVEALKAEGHDLLQYGTAFTKVIREQGRTTGVEVQVQGKPMRIGTKLVVGADGPFSQVRHALEIPTDLYRYKDGYLVAMLESHEELDEAQYCVGKRTILGVFPAAGKKTYVFFMLPAHALPDVKTHGIEALRGAWSAIYPPLTSTFASLEDWAQTAYMGTGRVRAKTWVSDGAVLIGDAAHGMNPHASQGRMQAMADAVVLADVIQNCMEKDDWSSSALGVFEARRRPQVTMLQRLADEEVLFWNSGNVLLTWLRNRVFRTLDRNQRLQFQVLSATAGLRETPPFNWLDRLQAAGLVPDPRAGILPLSDGSPRNTKA